MHFRSRPGQPLVVATALSALAGCQLIAATETLVANPVNTANALPGYGDAAVPASYNGRVRIADLAVTPGYTDFCIRASGTDSWGEPVMKNAGTDTFFRTGLAYPQVTIPFAVPSGKIDVKFIPAAGTCASSTLSEGDGIEVGVAVVPTGSSAVPAPVMTILRYGGNTGGPNDTGVPERVAGLPEESSANHQCPDCSKFRVVNAAASPNFINFGFSDGNTTVLPATVTNLVLDDAIAPGTGPSAQSDPAEPSNVVDNSGYYGIAASAGGGQASAALGVVSAPAGTVSHVAVATFQPSPLVVTETLYLIGDPNNNLHPIQGLLVEDNLPATGPADAGVDYQFLAKSVLTTPSTISVDTLNTSLYGLLAPYSDARRLPLIAALSTRQTDVICLSEIDFDSDKQAVAAGAAQGNFPYSYWVPTTITTPPRSAVDWFGNTPPLLTSAACASEAPATISSVTECASQCSTGPDDDLDAGISSMACLAAQCFSALVPLLSNSNCADCVLMYLSDGFPIGDSMNECTSDTNDPYGQFSWGGANGTMILSRYPFAQKADGGGDDTEAYVFPGSSFRRAALRVRLQLDPTSQMDVYCGQFVSSLALSNEFLYAGEYATPNAGLYPDESTADNGFRDEDSLQAQDMLQWIAARSGNNPAIIAGDWHASLGFTTDAGSAILAPFVPEVSLQFLDAGLVPAHPSVYSPACAECNSNPYNLASPMTTDGTMGYDWTTTYLYNFAPDSTLAEAFWDTTPSEWAVVLPNTDGGLAPISDSYPRSVQILRP